MSKVNCIDHTLQLHDASQRRDSIFFCFFGVKKEIKVQQKQRTRSMEEALGNYTHTSYECWHLKGLEENIVRYKKGQW